MLLKNRKSKYEWAAGLELGECLEMEVQRGESRRLRKRLYCSLYKLYNRFNGRTFAVKRKVAGNRAFLVVTRTK